MRRIRSISGLFILGAALSLLAAPVAHSGPPGKWTKIATADGYSDQVGMARTPDGHLHLVWIHMGSGSTPWGYRSAELSQTGQVVDTGSVLSGWYSLENDPRLIRDGNALRLVFAGTHSLNASDFFAKGAVYTSTSPTGKTWALQNGSMANHTVLNDGLAAVDEANGTPVAAFGLNNVLFFHEGVDSSSPAATADGSVTGQGSTASWGVNLARLNNDSVSMAWFQRFGTKQGYYAAQILPSKTAAIKAPESGNKNQDNEPSQQVAFAARVGGGAYLAYCVPSKTKPCVHLALWKVGAAHAMTVPGSGSGNAALVSLAANPGGRMSVTWYDKVANVIRSVRTNTGASKFGVLRTVKPPGSESYIYRLQTEGSSGRLDIIINDLSKAGHYELWHTQVLPGLKLTASPSKFSHKHSAKVKFSVTDAGQAVAGAKVSCLGKKDTTGQSGTVTINFPKHEPDGGHVCRATKSNYYGAKATIHVT